MGGSGGLKSARLFYKEFITRGMRNCYTGKGSLTEVCPRLYVLPSGLSKNVVRKGPREQGCTKELYDCVVDQILLNTECFSACTFYLSFCD